MTEPPVPATEAGRRLGVDMEGMLGLQFKSRDLYRSFLRDAEYLALEIEKQARAAAEQQNVALREALEIIATEYHGDGNGIAIRTSNIARAALKHTQTANARGYAAGLSKAEGRAAGDAPLDVERVSEAWANVMDGTRVEARGSTARIGRGTTTPDDWRAIAIEYARLASGAADTEGAAE